MKLTLQKRIGYFWLILATLDIINLVYKTILRFGTWGLYSNKFYSRPYFEQIFPYALFPKISAASSQFQMVLASQWCFFLICSLISVLIPIMLILNKKHSRTIAKVFLILFILVNVFAIYIMTSMLSPIRDSGAIYGIENDAFVRKLIYYYSTISFISILMFFGLLYCESKKQEIIV